MCNNRQHNTIDLKVYNVVIMIKYTLIVYNQNVECEVNPAYEVSKKIQTSSLNQ